MKTVFRADDEPVQTRLDHWQHVLSDTIGPLQLHPSADPGFRDRLVVAPLGAVQVAELSVVEGRAERTARHLRSARPDLCTIDVGVSGRTVVEQRGRQVELGPGDLTVIEPSRPGRWIVDRARLVAVTFPRHLLAVRDDELSRLTGVRIPGARGPGALASSLVRALPAHVDGTDEASAARLGGAVLDVLATALLTGLGRAAELPPSTQRRARLHQVHGYIEEHLADPTLTPRTVASANALSLRSLHQLFETEPATVAEWIRLRRLERCRRDLLDPALRDRPVSAIAARWGFIDPAHFSRLFRATHGVPPSVYRSGGPIHTA